MKGAIILVESKKNTLLAKAIKFFTGRLAKKYRVKSYTHAMFCVGEVLGEPSVFSAEASMTIMPLRKFTNRDFEYDVYAINDDLSDKEVDKILRAIYIKTAGETYGFLQLLWFIYRWFMELIGFDVRKQKNWFPIGDVCSEHTYRYLKTRLLKKKNRKIISKTLSQLEEWNENTFHPVDLAKVIKDNPQLFIHFCGYKDDTVVFLPGYNCSKTYKFDFDKDCNRDET